MSRFTLYRLYERLEEEKGISFQEFKEIIRFLIFLLPNFFHFDFEKLPQKTLQDALKALKIQTFPDDRKR